MTVSSAVITVGTFISGITATACGISDLSEASQDVIYGFQGSDKEAVNLIRDTLFAGNEDMYYDVEFYPEPYKWNGKATWMEE